MKFLFYDDPDITLPNYQYNQYSDVTLTDNVLVDLSLAANAVHRQIITDFVMKRNCCLTIVSEALDPLVLSGPILKIFGKQIKDSQMIIDDEGGGVRSVQFFRTAVLYHRNEFGFFTREQCWNRICFDE